MTNAEDEQSMAHMYGDASRRVQILHSSPSCVGFHHCSLRVLRSALNLLPKPSQHHGQNTRYPLQNPRRFCPRVQRHHTHPRTHLREIHCPLPPQHHRPPPRHHVVAANGRRFIRLDLRHGLGSVGGKEKTGPQVIKDECVLVAPSVFPNGCCWGFHLRGAVGVLLRRNHGWDEEFFLMFLCEIGIGSWLSTALVKIIEGASGGQHKGWLRNDFNNSRLDCFY